MNEREIKFANLCCDEDDLHEVKNLLSDPELNVHYNNEEAFKCACINSRINTVKLLLTLDGERKINVNINNDEIFMNACYDGRSDVVKLLLDLEDDRKIDINRIGQEALLNALYTYYYALQQDPSIDLEEGNKDVAKILINLKGERKIDLIKLDLYRIDKLLYRRLLVIMIERIFEKKREKEIQRKTIMTGLKKIRVIQELKSTPTGEIINIFPGGSDFIKLIKKYQHD